MNVPGAVRRIVLQTYVRHSRNQTAGRDSGYQTARERPQGPEVTSGELGARGRTRKIKSKRIG